MPAGWKRVAAAPGILAGLLAFGLFRLGLGTPASVESAYTEGFYPFVISAFSWITGLFPFSVAETLVIGAVALVLVRLVLRVFRRRAPRGLAVTSRWRQLAHLLLLTLSVTGALYAVFVVVWGLNYARPRLEPRLGLSTRDIAPEEIARFAEWSAAETTRLHRSAGLPEGAISENPLGYRELSLLIDEAYDAIGLPGDPRGARAAPVKPAMLSPLMSRLGISGIFVPFTGEPHVNTGPPDVAIAFTAAHEKAHQRAITHEGEASFAAWRALARPGVHPYLHYAASFYATRHLIASTSPEDRDHALAELGAGPRHDMEALNRFWAQHRGLVRVAARRVNDSYLRTMRVPGGTRSYGSVVRMLVGDFRERERPAFESTDDRN